MLREGRELIPTAKAFQLMTLLRGLDAPIVTTLHTVLETPSAEQRAVLEELCALSAGIVVMSARAVDILVRQACRAAVRLIHHACRTWRRSVGWSSRCWARGASC